MLEKDPKKRISSEQALQHPYFAKKEPKPTQQQSQFLQVGKEGEKEYDILDDEISEDNKDGTISKAMK